MQTNKFDLNAISGVQDLSDTAAEKYCGGRGGFGRLTRAERREALRAQREAFRASSSAAIEAARLANPGGNISVNIGQTTNDGVTENNIDVSVPATPAPSSVIQSNTASA